MATLKDERNKADGAYTIFPENRYNWNMRAKKIKEYAPVESYKHQDQRVSIPTQELSAFVPAEQKRPKKTTYKYDPSLDPQLIWAGKEENTELNVDSVPIFIQEKISPEAIIAKLRDEGSSSGIQYQLFGDVPDQNFNKIVDFYKHTDNWRNRLILGDSLQVMNSLVEKEGMHGKVQMVYIDPPYGIKFSSNWQVRSDKTDIKDGKDEYMVRQPEQIKAYRDTWEYGIHSYLAYLRDRLKLCNLLLSESGSCFVQISSDNVHLIRCLLDEEFGSHNFVSLINFRRKINVMNPKYIGVVNDYIVYYAKNIDKLKFRKLFIPQKRVLGGTWGFIETLNGERRRITKNEIENPSILPQNSKIFASYKLAPAGFNSNATFKVKYQDKMYDPPLTAGGKSWKTNEQGMKKLVELNRVMPSGDTLRFVSYIDDFPYSDKTNPRPYGRGF